MDERCVLMSGNEAIARGAFEAGARLVAGYPGTPSTEIIEAAAQYREMYSEWSPNEKVAMEVGIGAAFGGALAMVTMKHVGLNVAADPLLSVSYMHIDGALVIVSADDPGMWSSQNEQDNRIFARFARIPMFEPSDSQEAKDMTIEAFRLSKKFGVPVLIRTTTRLAHTRCPVVLGERQDVPQGPEAGERLTLRPELTVMIPSNARVRHPAIEKRLSDIAMEAEESAVNCVENSDARGLAFIVSGIPYQYVKEAFPGSPVLKLGLSYPLPVKMIRDFCAQHEEVYVIEELDPLVETELKALGMKVSGKGALTNVGEYSVPMLKSAFADEAITPPEPAAGLPPRPPQLCPGCPHRGILWALSNKKTLVFGDIGCYTLGVAKPLQAVHSCVCMGASIGNAHGMEKALGRDITSNHVAMIGDSTFYHSGITGLLNIVYNSGASKVVIVDNSTTAMTGHQGNPGSGLSALGKTAPKVDLVQVVKALGIENVQVVDPYQIKATRSAVDDVLKTSEPGVIISRRECVLLKSAQRKPAVEADIEKCRACGLCFKLGCPALYKVDGKTAVDATICTGCSMCVQVCPFGALKEATLA